MTSANANATDVPHASVSTASLLTCGILAGPLYVAATAIQAMTRDGFDPRQHRYNLLTTGDPGWIHRANYIVAGMLMVMFAVGVGRLLQRDRGGRWAARLFVIYGVAFLVPGIMMWVWITALAVHLARRARAM